MHSTRQPSPILLLARLFWFCVAVGLGIYTALTVWLGLAGMTYPYQLDYGEGAVLWFTRLLAHGQSIYKGMTGLPYASSNYPPVGMALMSALTPLLGEGYVGGRLLNFASVLITSVLIFRIVQGQGSETSEESRRTAIGGAMVAALFFLGSPYIYHWAPLYRVDLIGLALSIAGVYVVWRWEREVKDEGGRRKDEAIDAHKGLGYSYLGIFLHPSSFILLTLALLLFLLALYTKQTLFAAPAAGLVAIARYDKRAAVAFGAALLGVGGGLYLLVDYATSGGFTFGLITSNASVFSMQQLASMSSSFALTFSILLMLALWVCVRRVRSGRWGVLEVYWVAAIAVIVLSGRMGAWENYYFEAVAATCILVGSAVVEFDVLASKSRRALDFASIGLPILLLAQLALFQHDHDPRIASDMMARDYASNQQLAALLSRTPGTIISEDMGALLTSDRPLVYYTYQYSMLARSGKWDQSWELDNLRSGSFPLVILERGTREDVDHYARFTRQFLSALDLYYGKSVEIGKYIAYAPAPLEHLQAADFGDDIHMLGWSADEDKAVPGQVVVSIVWQAKRAITRRNTAFLHLEDGAGKILGQDDHEPMTGIYPTNHWGAGEMVRDSFRLKGDLAMIRSHVLRVGWYDTETEDRLPVAGSADNMVVLDQVQ